VTVDEVTDTVVVDVVVELNVEDVTEDVVLDVLVELSVVVEVVVSVQNPQVVSQVPRLLHAGQKAMPQAELSVLQTPSSSASGLVKQVTVRVEVVAATVSAETRRVCKQRSPSQQRSNTAAILPHSGSHPRNPPPRRVRGRPSARAPTHRAARCGGAARWPKA